MKKQGTIRRWEAERGFGFIDSSDSSNVFFHIRDFASKQTPAAGMRVSYEEIQVGGKGPRAMKVELLGQASAPAPVAPRNSNRPRTSTKPASGSQVIKVMLLLWVILLGVGLWRGRLDWVLLGIVALLNLATYMAYKLDKNAAQQGRWRTAEKTLHLLSLFGGWPMAWYAQQAFRHKTSKQEFRVVYWATVIGNCLLLAALVLTSQGANILSTGMRALRGLL